MRSAILSLLDEGLIAPNGEGARTEFDLTDEGRAYLTDRADELAGAWTTPRHPMQELYRMLGE